MDPSMGITGTQCKKYRAVPSTRTKNRAYRLMLQTRPSDSVPCMAHCAPSPPSWPEPPACPLFCVSGVRRAQCKPAPPAPAVSKAPAKNRTCKSGVERRRMGGRRRPRCCPVIFPPEREIHLSGHGGGTLAGQGVGERASNYRTGLQWAP